MSDSDSFCVLHQSELKKDAIVGSINTTIIVYLGYNCSYWKRRGVPFIVPSIPFGNYGPLFRFAQSISQNTHDLYKSSNEPVIVIYIGLRSGLLICDPKIVEGNAK